MKRRAALSSESRAVESAVAASANPPPTLGTIAAAVIEVAKPPELHIATRPQDKVEIRSGLFRFSGPPDVARKIWYAHLVYKFALMALLIFGTAYVGSQRDDFDFSNVIKAFGTLGR